MLIWDMIIWKFRRIFKIQNVGPDATLFEPDKTKLRLVWGSWVGPDMNHHMSEFIAGYDDLTEIVDGERVWK